MNINIKIFPALNGDCLLIKAGETNILIDGGYVNTYKEYLKPALIELSSEGVNLSLVVVSHIDADHISGILKFIEENEQQNIIPIQNIWHNSFRHLCQNEQIDSNFDEKQVFGDIKKELFPDLERCVSAKQGSSLATLLLKYNYPWNRQFEGNAVSLDTIRNVPIQKDINIILLSPNNEKLGNLSNYWRKELYKNGYLEVPHSIEFWDDAFEYLLAQEKQELRYVEQNISHKNDIDFHRLKEYPYIPDISPTNGSSISFILQIGDRKLLLLADSHSDLIVKELKKIFQPEEFPVFFDLIKLSHHGSFSNNSPELLNMIDSDKIIISTNGKIFNHPDMETLAWIITKKNGIKRRLYFNYHHQVCHNLSDNEIKEKYNYEVVLLTKGETIEILL